MNTQVTEQTIKAHLQELLKTFNPAYIYHKFDLDLIITESLDFNDNGNLWDEKSLVEIFKDFTLEQDLVRILRPEELAKNLTEASEEDYTKVMKEAFENSMFEFADNKFDEAVQLDTHYSTNMSLEEEVFLFKKATGTKLDILSIYNHAKEQGLYPYLEVRMKNWDILEPFGHAVFTIEAKEDLSQVFFNYEEDCFDATVPEEGQYKTIDFLKKELNSSKVNISVCKDMYYAEDEAFL